MTTNKASHSKLRRAWRWLRGWPARYWHRGWWPKLQMIVVVIIVVCLGIMYSIAQWYIWSERGKPFELGTSFIPSYAQSLGLDPQQTMSALINDVGVKHFRLVSYWDQLEPSPGQFDFSSLDWQFQKVEAAHGTVSLSLGLRQPRWPECHMPSWAASEPKSVWEGQLNTFITAVVDRYKTSSALQSYQIENEYFLKGFGICDSIPGAEDRSRLVSEYNLVNRLDTKHTIIINRSQNDFGWPIGQPQPDEFGISVYKRVWDATLTHRYLEYPQPAWYYAFVAGWTKIFTGRDTIIHELQAEPWGPNGKSIDQISAAEGNKSLDAKRLSGRVAFAKGTGMKQAYLWGSEYWYFRMEKQHDPSLWNTAKHLFADPQ